MHQQLIAIRKELDANSDAVSGIAERATDDQWVTKPNADSWSVSECVQHLNVTTKAMLPLMNAVLSGSEPEGKAGRYRFSLAGLLIWWSSSPRSRFKVKTAAPFVPEKTNAKQTDLDEWGRCQSDVASALELADGHPLNRLKMASPFDSRVSYNLYSAFRIITAHQRRHLDQAERALEVTRGV